MTGGAALARAPGEPGLAGVSSAVVRGFEQAADASGVHERALQIAGREVRIRCAGPALLRMVMPALEHLAVANGGEPDLVVAMWDSASTGIAAVPMPAVPVGDPPLVQYLAHDPPRWTVCQPRQQAACVYDADTRRAWQWHESAQLLDDAELAVPLRRIIHWWALRHGLQLVHAGGVGSEHRAVLVTGRGGSGKSTVTLACLRAGLQFLGDDRVLVEAGDPVRAYSLYSSAKLEPDHARRVPELLPVTGAGVRRLGDKVVAFLAPYLPARMATVLPVAAVVVPRFVGGGPSRLAPVSRAHALGAMAPTSILSLPGAGGAELSAMSEIVARLPCYRLDYGTDLGAIAATVATLLDAP